jgi:AraC-like DNA-binding protein
MKELLQKLPLKENASFVCRRYRTPHFETPWHQHIEYELILITEGTGNILAGDYIGEYEEGDVFFLGSNLPHWFRKREGTVIGSAIVIHFNETFIGHKFWLIPEMNAISRLLKTAARGIHLKGSLKRRLAELIAKTENQEGYLSLRCLLDCLYEISASKNNRQLLASGDYRNQSETDGMIGRIFEYTFRNFRNEIKLAQVAKLLNMSIPTFTRYFKKNTKKTYIQFLKEVRIAHACKLLAKDDLSISYICSNSGYNNWANFCRQFAEAKKMTPSDYRRRMHAETSG